MKLNVTGWLTFRLVQGLSIGLRFIAFSQRHIVCCQLIKKVIPHLSRRRSNCRHILFQLRPHPHGPGTLRLNGSLLLSLPPRRADPPAHSHDLLGLLLCDHLGQLVGFLDSLSARLWRLRGSPLAHLGGGAAATLGESAVVLGSGGAGNRATALAQFAV